jgi:hypothetical protein
MTRETNLLSPSHSPVMIHPPRHPSRSPRGGPPDGRFSRTIHSPLLTMSITGWGKCRTHARTHANAPMAGIEVGSDGTKLGSSHDVVRSNKYYILCQVKSKSKSKSKSSQDHGRHNK